MSAPSAFFDPRAIAALVDRVREAGEGLQERAVLMEVCGTHTHAIAAAGLRRLLPPSVRLISGPGCPVCVTPVDYLDRAEALAALPDTIVCTFGDLMRVPSSLGSLERARARGRSVRVVYSPRDALDIARAEPGKRVIFLAVGFETTAPTSIAAVEEAERLGIRNFLILPGNKIVPPPLRALAVDPDVRISGVLLPGHVSVVTGWKTFEFLPAEFGVPATVVGFTPADVMRGVLEIVEELRDGRAQVTNLYPRVVTAEGNPHAKALLEKFFEPADTRWRGLGVIPASGLALRPAFAHRDASRIEVALPEPLEPLGCRCGEVLKGTIDPPECPLFDNTCTPETPVGACMVSSEGTCAAWHRHDRWSAGASA